MAGQPPGTRPCKSKYAFDALPVPGSRWLAPNRSPERYVAGGIALHAREDIRWSVDLDVFHDVEQAVIHASEAGIHYL